ncbi:component of anaerobic dehydrogenase [Sulfolobus acidocaldarius SUSAZ]|nr:component of anaerobic dehydrogenase [Sulfolobus acidocaldarius SUSAZ]
MSSEQAILRFLIYDTFSEIFLYKIEDKEFNDMLDKLNDVTEKVGGVLKEIANVDMFEIRKKFKSKSKKDYLIEYTTLFLTGFGNKPLTPVESKRNYLLIGEGITTFRYNDIVRFYTTRGLVMKSRSFMHEPDHISTILGFMSFLIREEINLSKDNGDISKIVMDQYNFMTTHIMSWVPEWINDVLSDGRSDIFRPVCANLGRWINYDYSQMSKRAKFVGTVDSNLGQSFHGSR